MSLELDSTDPSFLKQKNQETFAEFVKDLLDSILNSVDSIPE